MTRPQIITMQRRLVEVGRVRMGQKKTSAKGKQYPAALDTFRLTSRDKTRLDAAALIYGGTVEPWEGQWELFTEADALSVAVVPGQALSQSFEQWGQKKLTNNRMSGVICLRRCDGITEYVSGNECPCANEEEQSCKPTTRLSVILTRVPGLGVWRCETHGWNAASELAGSVQLLESLVATGTPVKARLRLDKRTSKTETETREFVVPVVDIDHTLSEVLALQRGDQPTLAGGAVAIEAGIESAPTPFKPVPVADLPEAPVAPIAEQLTATKPARAPRKNAAPAIPPTRLPVGGGELIEPEPEPEAPTKDHVNRVAIAARNAGLDDDGRHDVAEYVSDGRTRSSKELTVDEIATAIAVCNRITQSGLKLIREDGALNLVSQSAEHVVTVNDPTDIGGPGVPAVLASKERVEAVTALASEANIGGWVKAQQYDWPWSEGVCSLIEERAERVLMEPF